MKDDVMKKFKPAVYLCPMNQEWARIEELAEIKQLSLEGFWNNFCSGMSEDLPLVKGEKLFHINNELFSRESEYREKIDPAGAYVSAKWAIDILGQ